MIRVNSIIRRSTCRFGLVLLAVAFVLTQSVGARADVTNPRMSIVEGNVQKAPAFFKFQSRISQGKIPLGDVTFDLIIVNIKNGSEIVCSEKFEKVKVQDSVLNLEIGRGTNGTCDMDSVAAKYSDLQFVVCLNSNDNCLKPVSFASVPYAVKANYAVTANKASRANEAVQCHYAHRVTADRDLFVTQALGKGYFDFYTPTQEYFDNEADLDGLFWYEDAAQSIPNRYRNGGYIQWAGMNPDGNNLHICASGSNLDGLPPIPLDELVMHADLSRFAGQLVVEGPATGTAPGAVFKKGVQVGYEKDKYRLIVWDRLEVNGTSNFNGDVFANKVTVGESAGFKRNDDAPPIFEVYGNANFHGTVNIDADVDFVLKPDSVGSAELSEIGDAKGAAVKTANIEDGAVTPDKLSSDVRMLTTDSVGYAELSEIGDAKGAAVKTANIEKGAVTPDKLSDDVRVLKADSVGSIELSEIGDAKGAAVRTANILDRAVTSAKLNLQISHHAFNKEKDCPWACGKNLGSTTTINACFLTTVPYGDAGCQVKIDEKTKQWQMIGTKVGCEAMCF